MRIVQSNEKEQGNYNNLDNRNFQKEQIFLSTNETFDIPLKGVNVLLKIFGSLFRSHSVLIYLLSMKVESLKVYF